MGTYQGSHRVLCGRHIEALLKGFCRIHVLQVYQKNDCSSHRAWLSGQQVQPSPGLWLATASRWGRSPIHNTSVDSEGSSTNCGSEDLQARCFRRCQARLRKKHFLHTHSMIVPMVHTIPADPKPLLRTLPAATSSAAPRPKPAFQDSFRPVSSFQSPQRHPIKASRTEAHMSHGQNSLEGDRIGVIWDPC